MSSNLFQKLDIKKRTAHTVISSVLPCGVSQDYFRWIAMIRYADQRTLGQERGLGGNWASYVSTPI